MYRTLNDVIAVNGKNKLPMLPDVHDVYPGDYGMVMFGSHKPGHKKRKRKVVKRKRKVVRKRKTVPKSLKTQAKKLGVKLTVKRGNKRVAKSEKVLRGQVMRRKAMKAKKAKKVVKRKTVKRRVKRKVTKRRKTKRRVKRKTTLSRSSFGKRKRSRNARFGTYWDNTQLLYAKSAASQQPAGTAGGNMYPYEGDMMPFYPIGGNAYGRKRNKGRKGRKVKFGMPTAPMNRGMWNGARSMGSRNYQPNSFQMPLNGLNSPSGMVRDQTPMGQGVSRNYCKSGTQCGSFPRAITQAYPFTTDTRMASFGQKKTKKKAKRNSKR